MNNNLIQSSNDHKNTQQINSENKYLPNLNWNEQKNLLNEMFFIKKKLKLIVSREAKDRKPISMARQTGKKRGKYTNEKRKCPGQTFQKNEQKTKLPERI